MYSSNNNNYTTSRKPTNLLLHVFNRPIRKEHNHLTRQFFAEPMQVFSAFVFLCLTKSNGHDLVFAYEEPKNQTPKYLMSTSFSQQAPVQFLCTCKNNTCFLSIPDECPLTCYFACYWKTGWICAHTGQHCLEPKQTVITWWSYSEDQIYI